MEDRMIPETQIEQIMERIVMILKRGNDVEIRTCKDGYKVIDVSRRSSFIISKK